MDQAEADPEGSCAVVIGLSRWGQNRGEVRGGPDRPGDGWRAADLIPSEGLLQIPYSLPPIIR